MRRVKKAGKEQGYWTTEVEKAYQAYIRGVDYIQSPNTDRQIQIFRDRLRTRIVNRQIDRWIDRQIDREKREEGREKREDIREKRSERREKSEERREK